MPESNHTELLLSILVCILYSAHSTIFNNSTAVNHLISVRNVWNSKVLAVAQMKYSLNNCGQSLPNICSDEWDSFVDGCKYKIICPVPMVLQVESNRNECSNTLRCNAFRFNDSRKSTTGEMKYWKKHQNKNRENKNRTTNLNQWQLKLAGWLLPRNAIIIVVFLQKGRLLFSRTEHEPVLLFQALGLRFKTLISLRWRRSIHICLAHSNWKRNGIKWGKNNYFWMAGSQTDAMPSRFLR